jgi:hypothetical protein
VARVTGRRRFVSSATTRILQFSGVRESTAPGPRLRRTDECNAERPSSRRVSTTHFPTSGCEQPQRRRSHAAELSISADRRPPRLPPWIADGCRRTFNRDHPHQLPATVGPAQPRIRPPGCTMPNAALRRTCRASTESTAPPRLRSHRSAPGSCQPCAGPDYAVDIRRAVSSSSADHEDL